jgi:hypothetical protein
MYFVRSLKTENFESIITVWSISVLQSMKLLDPILVPIIMALMVLKGQQELPILKRVN